MIPLSTVQQMQLAQIDARLTPNPAQQGTPQVSQSGGGRAVQTVGGGLYVSTVARPSWGNRPLPFIKTGEPQLETDMHNRRVALFLRSSGRKRGTPVYSRIIWQLSKPAPRNDTPRYHGASFVDFQGRMMANGGDVRDGTAYPGGAPPNQSPIGKPMRLRNSRFRYTLNRPGFDRKLPG